MDTQRVIFPLFKLSLQAEGEDFSLWQHHLVITSAESRLTIEKRAYGYYT